MNRRSLNLIKDVGFKFRTFGSPAGISITIDSIACIHVCSTVGFFFWMTACVNIHVRMAGLLHKK